MINKSKILMVIYNTNDYDITNYTLPYIKDYCNYHHYDFLEMNDTTKETNLTKKWYNKSLHVIDTCNKNLENYDYVVYIDLDILIVDRYFDLTKVLNPISIFYISNCYYLLNAGFFILKNDKRIFDFLNLLQEKIKYNCTNNIIDECGDQDIINNIISGGFFKTEEIGILSDSFFQYSPKDNGMINYKNEPQFLIHLYGTNNQDRKTFLEKYLTDNIRVPEPSVFIKKLKSVFDIKNIIVLFPDRDLNCINFANEFPNIKIVYDQIIDINSTIFNLSSVVCDNIIKTNNYTIEDDVLLFLNSIDDVDRLYKIIKENVMYLSDDSIISGNDYIGESKKCIDLILGEPDYIENGCWYKIIKNYKKYHLNKYAKMCKDR